MTVPTLIGTLLGPAGGAPLLLGPSLGTTVRLWARAAALLGSQFTLLAWDLPGHGRSPATTHPFSVAELAEGVIDEGRRTAMDAEAIARVDEAVAFADASPFPTPESLYDDVYVLGGQVRGWWSVDTTHPESGPPTHPESSTGEVPQAMTHQSFEGSAAAVPPDLVRLSCGVEAAEDLVEVLRSALSTSAS